MEKPLYTCGVKWGNDAGLWVGWGSSLLSLRAFSEMPRRQALIRIYTCRMDNYYTPSTPFDRSRSGLYIILEFFE